MHVMATLEDTDRFHTRKHVLCADRAVTMEGILEADVFVKDRQIDAAPALGTVLVVDPEAFPYAAQAAVFTVEDRLIGIRKEVTDVAVILCELLFTSLFATKLRTRLHLEAMHAYHLFDRVSVDFVWLMSVMAQTTGVEFSTTGSFNLCLTWVMFTSKYALFFILQEEEGSTREKLEA